MGQRAYMDCIENGQTTTYYGHWAANDLTTVLRYSEALELQKEHPDMTVSHILGNLSYESEYKPDAQNPDRVFQICKDDEVDYAHASFKEQGDIEQHIILDLDKQELTYHYDPMYHDGRPSVTLPLPQAVETMERVMKAAEEQGVEDFWKIAWMMTKEIDPEYHQRVEAERAAEEDKPIKPIINTADPVVKQFAEELIAKAADHGFTVAYVGTADEEPPPTEDEDEAEV